MDVRWWGQVKERDALEDLSLDGRILKWTLNKFEETEGDGLICLRIGKIEGLFLHGSEVSDVIKNRGISLITVEIQGC